MEKEYEIKFLREGKEETTTKKGITIIDAIYSFYDTVGFYPITQITKEEEK